MIVILGQMFGKLYVTTTALAGPEITIKTTPTAPESLTAAEKHSAAIAVQASTMVNATALTHRRITPTPSTATPWNWIGRMFGRTQRNT
ncbi:hypothetical protein [Ruegeria arenilitoris]|uniref:hypothetical protein n=1 Tax=Ruegeria arenilitoris TaxID=1173585 RepID=UPI0020C33EAE|nr:hypothetical protein [Ruegeria arenilitoris]